MLWLRLGLVVVFITASLGVTTTVRGAETPATWPLPSLADDLCVPSAQLTGTAHCAPYGPGTFTAQYAAAVIPKTIPLLPDDRLPRPAKVVELDYARVLTPDAPVFASPEDAITGAAAGTLGKGFVFVNIVRAEQIGEQVVYRIRTGQYVRATDVKQVEPSEWQGVPLQVKPKYPVGWIVKTVRPSPMPGVKTPREGERVWRNQMIQIFASVRVGKWEWYLIGPGQWVEQRVVSVITFNSPPEGVTGKWVQVNLYEQNMVAYEGTRPVYATLISSGLDRWATEPGVFEVYARLPNGKMSGAYAPDRSDYYFLEAVPWIMYFDGDRALHGQYWHDSLGYKRSHGCVNLAPLDAQWLYDWSELGLHVWVYDPSKEVKAEVGVAEGP
jgi:hypothetical protein